MASNENALLKEVLDAVKALQLNQTLLASNVDAISGRVNVLAGMKQVREAAESSSSPAATDAAAAAAAPAHAEQESLASVLDSEDEAVPQSPSLPIAQLDAARKPRATGRIILT